MVKEIEIRRAVELLLNALGEDSSREGIKDTPARVAKFLSEFSSQNERINIETEKKLVKIFYEPKTFNSNQMVTVKDIPFCSLCEHHLLPFFGTVDISYIPKIGKILGLSKFSRVVNYFSKKLQTQERLTEQIAEFLFSNVSSTWLKVTVRAVHICVVARGARSVGSSTETEVTKGKI